ncbi:MAG: hypothetical protein ACK559_42450, partial [bacterium]
QQPPVHPHPTGTGSQRARHLHRSGSAVDRRRRQRCSRPGRCFPGRADAGRRSRLPLAAADPATGCHRGRTAGARLDRGSPGGRRLHAGLGQRLLRLDQGPGPGQGRAESG